ncbi:hypothetical protein JOM56_014730 [Amanita muscaria]
MDNSMYDEQDSGRPSPVPSLNSPFLPPGPHTSSSLGSHHNSVPPHSHPPSSFSRLSSSHSLRLHRRKPYARSPGPTPSDARALTFPFPLAQPCRSTPSSDQTPYSSSYSGLSHSDFLNPYTQSSTVAPHLNSYDATADLLSQQHGDLLHMRIEDLLWIPSVERMFAAYNELKDHCVDLSSTIASITKTQTKMYDDVALLRLQLEEARWQVPPPTSGYYANMNCKRSPNLLDHRATAATRFGNSSERPEQFPAAILWTFADAKKDLAVGITLTNPNRPNLKQIIRTTDGSVVDDSIYSTVRSSAHNVAATLLAPLDSKRPELKGAIGRKSPGTKSFYKNYFKDQWMAALEHLEGLQPLLGLCAEHWKAEAVLQSVLTSLHPKKGNNSLPVDEPNGSSEEEAGNGQLEGKRSCVSPSVSRSPKHNQRMSVTRPAAADSTTAKSNRIKTFTPTVALKAKSTHQSKPTGVPQTPSASNPTRALPRPRPRTAVGTADLDTSTTGLDTTGLNTTGLGATGLGTTGLGVTGLGTTDSGTTGLDATGLGVTGLGATGMDETGMDETGMDETGLDETGADLGAAIEKAAGAMDSHAGANLTDNVDDSMNKYNGPIDVAFIKVTPTTENLKPAIDLVKSLDLDSTVCGSTIAESVESFIRGVELADPRSQEYEEDDLGASWGHYQFRGWREMLPTWQAIGPPENACRLIAAILKTCTVACALCHDLEMSERKIGSLTISYLSDNYLEQITEWLWELWKQAGGPLDKGKGKDLASTQLTSTLGSALSPSATQIETATINREELAAALQSWDADKLKTLQRDELARVISAHKLKLVETLLPALKSGPSEELVQDLYHKFQAIATAPRNARKKVVKG